MNKRSYFNLCVILFVVIFFLILTNVSGAWFFKREIKQDSDLSFGSVEIYTHNIIAKTTYNKESHQGYNVCFENVGTLDAVVRALTCVEWNNNLPMEETLEIGEDWTLKEDGYYYYNKILSPGEYSTTFLKGVIFNNLLKSGDYKIPIYVESAQVKNDVYKQLFDVGDEYE